MKHPHIKAWEQAAEGKKRPEDEHKTPKIGNAHVSASEARQAINAALEIAKSQKQVVAVGVCTGLLHICGAIDILCRDLELTQNRVTSVLRALNDEPTIDDYVRRGE